ncbi:CPBP family intramembrane glutamic endopeptidase [Spiroplasma culicicola]|uniref:CAAX amino terminal membrane bound protease n=1 Tax=Spiroplasma culicicola AES-1 TaxID=1276246 RepID=W6A6H4_9MOLU|nr:type II CAAX endopeptidase family protein [Spiroplasma culicicola]AHI52465.1 CAAX amino terminal membrane bound protease [Spiroplasma culicicola AES-1]
METNNDKTLEKEFAKNEKKVAKAMAKKEKKLEREIRHNERKVKFYKWHNKNYKLEDNQFRYNLVNWKTDGMIFLSCAFFIPVLFSLIGFFFFDLKTNNYTQATVELAKLISAAVGLFLLGQRHSRILWSGGFAWYFLYVLAPQFIVLILAFIPFENSDIFNMLAMLISGAAVLIIILKFDRVITKRMKETFKNHLGTLIVTSLIAFVAMFLISTMFFSSLIENTWLNLAQAENQNSLTGPLNDANTSTTVKIIYVIILFAYAVVVAPLLEEIVIRQSWFVNIGNKWAGLIFSSLFFGFMHYGTTGDYEHFLSYTSAGFCLGAVFIFSKANVTYSWMVHLLNNLTAFILMIIGAFA